MLKNEVKTTCSYCGVGCGIIVKKDANNTVFVEGDKVEVNKELEEEHKFFIDKRVNDYFFNQFPSDTSNFVDSKFVKSKLNDQTFKKILDQQITSLQYITENFYIEKIDELIKMITEELKKLS